ncbi:DNA cytosine methyltransferase [Allomuricauda sp. SCSIO 64092]|uniref:DNA cytosine methyltransferase n=1 Tax=Allomuricauda sp. SCSIO 64092 TaxID=2908842 RepID=UPI00391C2079
MNHFPIFAGINGFGLAADWLGWHQPAHCEIDAFCQKIIQYYWKNSKPYYDITKTDFTVHRGRTGVLSGGFPCQPFSNAGKRYGTDDGRYLWPEMLRAIRESKPFAVVGENVTGLLSMEEREVFARVDSRSLVRFENYDHYEAVYVRQSEMLVNRICEDLEKEGYQVQPFVIPAAGVGAPHRRDRIWIVAYANHFRRGDGSGQVQKTDGKISQWDHHAQFSDPGSGVAPDTTGKRGWTKTKEGLEVDGNVLEKTGRYQGTDTIEPYAANVADSKFSELQGSEFIGSIGETGKAQEKGRQLSGSICSKWENFPTQSPICGGDDGLSRELDGITFSKWRSESIKGFGNAIVPQVAYKIFKAIDEQCQELAY